MELSLRQIYKKKPRPTGWYKLAHEGACPNKDNLTSVAESSWDTFGCTSYDQNWEKDKKALAAKTCASERMADMKYHLIIGDPPDKGHIYPIAVAYGLGKQCVQGNKGPYTNQFRNWYKELVNGSAQTHALFQTELETNNEYPLEAYNPEDDKQIIAAKGRNPIIPAGQTKSPPKSNSSNNMNWKSPKNPERGMSYPRNQKHAEGNKIEINTKSKAQLGIMALTSDTAPPPDVPVSQEETEFYMDILEKEHDRYEGNHLMVEQMLANFDGDYSERAPDSFLKKAIIYMKWKPRTDEDVVSIKKYIKELIIASCNTDKWLRKMYAFWKERCNAQITNDVRCFMVMYLVSEMARLWARNSDVAKRKFVYSLSQDEYLPYYPIANQDDLVDQLRGFLFQPERVARLSIDHIKKMVEPACEN